MTNPQKIFFDLHLDFFWHLVNIYYTSFDKIALLYLPSSDIMAILYNHIDISSNKIF